MISSLAIKDGGLNLIIEFPEEMVIDQQYLTNQIEILIKEEFKSLKAVRIIFTTKKITSKPTQLTKIKHKIAHESVCYFMRFMMQTANGGGGVIGNPLQGLIGGALMQQLTKVCFVLWAL